MERIKISNFKGEILMNRRTEMGGVRVERTQYRIWGGNKKKEVDGGCLQNQDGARRISQYQLGGRSPKDVKE